MDSSDDAAAIRACSEKLGYVLLIDAGPRNRARQQKPEIEAGACRIAYCLPAGAPGSAGTGGRSRFHLSRDTEEICKIVCSQS